MNKTRDSNLLVTIATRIMSHSLSTGTLTRLRPFCFWGLGNGSSGVSCRTLSKSLQSRAHFFRCCSPMDDEKFSRDLSKCMNRLGAKTSSAVSRGSLPHNARPVAKMAATSPTAGAWRES